MTEQEISVLRDLQGTVREYHGDVKRRLDIIEDEVKDHRVAIYGVAGDDCRPGLNVEVQGLRGFRERFRLGLGAAWAGLVTIACTLWARR